MSQIVLNPMRKQLFQVQQPQQSHPKLSLTRVLWVKLLRWVDAAKWVDLKRALIKALWLVGIPTGVLKRDHGLGAVIALVTWEHGAIPICIGLFIIAFRWHRVLAWYQRRRLLQDRPENQYTFQGAPIGMLVEFLKANGSFKRDAALKALRISQPQYARIADALKQAGILVHGENNAHVMREIGRTLLTHQLEDLAEGRYPRYKYDEERDLWFERDGAAAQFIINNEFKQRQLEEKQERKIERKKREVAKLDEAIEEREAIVSPLAHIFAHSQHSAV